MSKNEKPPIAIVGAGGVGSLLGGMLVKSGENVALIGKQAHVEAIQQKGLTIEGVIGSFTVEIEASEDA